MKPRQVPMLFTAAVTAALTVGLLAGALTQGSRAVSAAARAPGVLTAGQTAAAQAVQVLLLSDDSARLFFPSMLR